MVAPGGLEPLTGKSALSIVSNSMVTIPPFLLQRWSSSLTRGTHQEPLIPPLFVAEQGPAVQIADIRPRDEAGGVLGYIPGSFFPGIEQLEQLTGAASSFPLVRVSATGRTAANVALRLEELGLEHVAVMEGGLAAWRALGFSTSRDPAGVTDLLEDVPETIAEPGPLTVERVRQHVGDPRSVRWIKLSSMIAHGRLSCIDGRDERGIIGSPGGDSGKFLLALAAIEQTTGKQLSEEEVTQGLLSHLDTFGHFYVHTDAHAFDALVGALKADPRLQTADVDSLNPEEWLEYLRQPPNELREGLLEYLVEPAHIGCGHIRLMLQHSDEYGIRKDLVLAYLRALQRLWWAGAPELTHTVLPGDHREAAVVNVRHEAGVWDLSRVPLISPACDGQQMFIYHPDVSAYLRRKTVQYLVRSQDPLGVEASQEARLQEAMDALSERQLGVTVGYLAKGLPIFDVVFSADGTFDVEEVSD
jgi:rhodanese-related sulfurtransferase